jgi:plastocyanin
MNLTNRCEEHFVMRRNLPLPLLTVLAILSVVLAACANNGGAESEAASSGAAASESEAAASESAAASEGGGEGDTVVISGFDFGDDITVAAGTVVTFQNDDDAEHSVTNGTDGTPADDPAFDEDVEAGESVEIPFDEAGTFDVTCRYHPDMQMTVTVE